MLKGNCSTISTKGNEGKKLLNFHRLYFNIKTSIFNKIRNHFDIESYCKCYIYFFEYCRSVWTAVQAFHLKAVDTIGNCKRLAFTVGVSQHMHKITNLWKFELNRSSNLRELCAFRWLISRPQVLNLRSRNQISGEITSFSKTMALQREPFLTMFYTINHQPLPKGFMLIIILSNYQ